MNNILKITKFHLLNLFIGQSIPFVATLLLNVIISVVVTNMAKAGNPGVKPTAGSLDPVALVWMFAMGMVFFAQSFKFMLSHGVSRRRFFFAAGFSLASMAAMWAIVVTIFVIVTRTFTSIWGVFDLLYRARNALSMVTWEFAALFLLAVIGWFIYLVYYVSGRKTKYIITAAPFVVAPLLVLFNVMTDGVIFQAVGRFFINAMGFSSRVPNPYIGVGSMLVLAVAFGGPIFLLLRRAQIND